MMPREDHVAQRKPPNVIRRTLVFSTALLIARVGESKSNAKFRATFDALSASFRVPGAQSIRFDFQDALNFRLTPTVGVGATCVVDGRIYLHLPPSLANAGKSQLLWVGELGPLPKVRSLGKIELRPTALAVDTTRQWTFRAKVHDLTAKFGDATSVLSVVPLPGLARAQYIVDTTMRAAMDMSLCGDGISRLVATWLPTVTARGLAIVAATGGVLLDGPIVSLDEPIALPSGLPVEDYRIPKGR
jgi:hypothetical protein